MSRPRTSTRVTLDLSPQGFDRLNAMVEASDLRTRVDVIREAIRLYDYMLESALKGYTFSQTSPEGTVEKLVFLSSFPKQPARAPQEDPKSDTRDNSYKGYGAPWED